MEESKDETRADAAGPTGARPASASARLENRVREIASPLLGASGLELDHVEYHDQGPRGLLQVFIDKPGGVTVDDCADASHQLEVALEADDPFPGPWTLEVSSPGLTRPLREARDYARFAGRLAVVTMRGAFEGRSKVLGRLAGVDGEVVRITEEDSGTELRLPLAAIARARLEVEPLSGAAPKSAGRKGGRRHEGPAGARGRAR